MTSFEAPREPVFPPLMQGEAAAGVAHPMELAQARAALGCDSGLIVHSLQANRLRAAVVLAPEVPLEQAMAMLPLAGVAFQNALGALAPPEVAVHLEWSGGLRINGASCGGLSVVASDTDPAAMPGWLIIGLDLPLLQLADDPGQQPDVTALYDEGCADVSPVDLLESWARHMLAWIARWHDEGNAALHTDWLALAHGVGEPVVMAGLPEAGLSGSFLGVDEDFGLLLRDDTTTHLVPLTRLLEADP